MKPEIIILLIVAAVVLVGVLAMLIRRSQRTSGASLRCIIRTKPSSYARETYRVTALNGAEPAFYDLDGYQAFNFKTGKNQLLIQYQWARPGLDEEKVLDTGVQSVEVFIKDMQDYQLWYDRQDQKFVIEKRTK